MKGCSVALKRLVITEMLAKYQILGSQHRLAAYVIGIHPFPAARQGTAVEDNHQTVVVGIAQNLLVQTQGLLLVTAEEVYFDTASHPDFATSASLACGQWSYPSG